MGQSENIILVMVFDSDESIRQNAISLIRKVKPQTAVWTFTVPVINFEVTNCYNLVNINQLNVTVTPLLSELSNETLQNLYKDLILEKKITRYPARCDLY